MQTQEAVKQDGAIPIEQIYGLVRRVGVGRPAIDLETVPDVPLVVYSNFRAQREYAEGNHGSLMVQDVAFPALTKIIVSHRTQVLGDDQKIGMQNTSDTLTIPFRTDDAV